MGTTHSETGKPGPIRCAIYTRKSTSQGLEEDFTTLDAQREACEAYITSQKHEGWQAIATRYDDGGFTGAHLDRPAMHDLLRDVEAGVIDCIVVYKVDRLSRSLLDFSYLLGRLEQHEVTFVSITQHFNTHTSMGRLTLNILLSFAQFEREMISERTRDKVAAARKKGKYCGGQPPLGYDVDHEQKRLVVNPEEAALVREIFQRYVHEQSLSRVAQSLTAQGHCQKRWITKAGKLRGGGPFETTRVQMLLRNPLYTGMVRHKGVLYDGEHEAIVSPELFECVQERLAKNRQTRTSVRRARVGLLPRGLVRCGKCGGLVFHTYGQKNGRKYRRYVCVTRQKRGSETCDARSVKAPELEQAVVERLREALHDAAWTKRLLKAANTLAKARVHESDFASCRDVFGDTWELLPFTERARLLDLLLEHVDYDGNGTLGLTFSPAGFLQFTEEMACVRTEGVA